MMKSKCLLMSAALSLFVAGGLRAQSVRWSVSPSYDDIQQVSEQLYRVTMAKGIGLVTADGKVVIDPGQADKITDFSDGIAIALKAEKPYYRLVGIIFEDGNSLFPPGEYYVDNYPFFSEGMLPVLNKKGQYGFMDKEGGLAIDCKYSSARPFCQGYAVVGTDPSIKIGSWSPIESKELFTYIDQNGIELSLDRALGKIYFGSSFYNDEATVKTKKGVFCTIGLNGQVKEMDVKPNLKFDWKYRLSDETDPESFEASAVINGPTTFQENGKYGFAKGSRRILSAQFEKATPFYDRYAVAKLPNGPYGILELIDRSIICSLERGSLDVSEKGKECVRVVVNLPEAFKDDEVFLRVYGESPQSETNSTFLDGPGITMRATEMILPSQTHNVELICNGLLVYSGSFEELGPEVSVTVTAALTAEKAGVDKKQPFVVVFTNTSNQDIKLPVSITGKKVTNKKTTVTVKAGKKARVTSDFIDVTEKEMRMITIQYGDETVTKSLQVKSIFD